MVNRDHIAKLEDILDKSLQNKPLSESEIIYLLGLKERDQIAQVFQAAQFQRSKYFGNKVFLYGFVYFSTYCRNNCTFCTSRNTNKLARRYRKSQSEIVEAAGLLAESGVHLIDLTMGEDPFYLNSTSGFNALLQTIEMVKEETGLPLMLSPGSVSNDMLAEFVRAGVDWYACYQETHNRQLFSFLRPAQDYDSRLSSKINARRLGILIEEGILTGVGESPEDIAYSTRTIKMMEASQARVMSFIPQIGTPMHERKSPSRSRELLTIAVLRLLYPDRLIPASLDVDGLDLLQERMEAGANVITSLIPPRLGLSGVSQPSLGIDEGSRTARSVASLLDEMGIEVAAHQEYFQWINKEKGPLSYGPVNCEAVL
jgi:methylornithine synthase